MSASEGAENMPNCFACGGEFEIGKLSVHGTMLGALLVGMSYQHCWFRPTQGTEDIVINSGGYRAAYRCKECGFIGIPPKSERKSPTVARTLGEVGRGLRAAWLGKREK